MFKTIGLIGKRGDERVASTQEALISILKDLPVDILVDAETLSEPSQPHAQAVDRARLGQSAELIIVIGGDGTFLSAARALVDYEVPLVGINLGRLGFLADIMPEEMAGAVTDILAGSYEEEHRFLLNTVIEREGEKVFEVAALNDVVAHKWHIARLIELQAYIDTRLVYKQRADGLIVSTPTGSTAYALSGGGPILHPNLNAIVLVPICPHSLTNRPIVVDSSSHIEVIMGSGEQVAASVTCDGQTGIDLEPGDRILIHRKDRQLRLIHPAQHDHYATLRAKLLWDRSKEY